MNTKLESWLKIVDLDLSKVRANLQSRRYWDASKNINLIDKEYRLFLYLIATNYKQTIVPWSDDLDELWHEHILDTKKYQEDCQKIFGRFIHHDPHLPKGSTVQVEKFQNTLKLRTQAIKELDTMYFGSPDKPNKVRSFK
jgi:hypothetical protein